MRRLEQWDMRMPADICDCCEINSKVMWVTLIPQQRSITAASLYWRHDNGSKMFGVMDAARD